MHRQLSNGISDFQKRIMELNDDAEVRRLTSGPHNYPKKRKRLAEKSCVVELAAMTLPDLEDLDSNDKQ